MKHLLQCILILLFTLLLCACGEKSASPKTDTDQSAETQVQKKTVEEIKTSKTPDEFVKTYFDAVCRGDAEDAIKCFTPNSREDWQLATALANSETWKTTGYSISEIMAYINTDSFENCEFTISSQQDSSDASLISVDVSLDGKACGNIQLHLVLRDNQWYIEESIDESVAQEIAARCYTFQSLETPFYNGAAWATAYDNTNTLKTVVVNEDFEIIYVLDKYGEKFRFTSFELGFAAVYPITVGVAFESESGFLIVDTSGKEVYEASEEENLYVCGIIEDELLVVKDDSGFSGKKWDLYSMDASLQLRNLNLVVDHTVTSYETDFIKLSDGIYIKGSKVINTKDGVFLNMYDTVDVIGDYILRGEYILPYSYITEAQTEYDVYGANSARMKEMQITTISELKTKIQKYFDFNIAYVSISLSPWKGGSILYSIDGRAGYFDLAGEKIFDYPQLPQGAHYRAIRCFEDGSSIVYMHGADGEGYVTAIDESGAMVYDPVAVSSEWTFDWIIHKHYVFVRDKIISPEGEMVELGDDLTSLDGDEPYSCSSYEMEIRITNGYIYYNYKKINTLCSLDGRTTIEKIYRCQ